MNAAEAIALITAVTAAVAAVGSLIRVLSSAKKEDVEKIAALCEQLQQDNDGLREENRALRAEYKALEDELDEAKNATAILRQRVTELAEENGTLHGLIGELREKIRSNGMPRPEIIAIMHSIPRMVSDLVDCVRRHPEIPDEVVEKLGNMATVITSIPALVAGSSSLYEDSPG